ncbi:hypothetical protein [Pontibacter sp. G13]|uniref:hypothetical protein n=1 Tax=Pontibacter sp. G13 TaxID=3074898 RepID=UPI00288C0B26|nr:hypothetical protein [Pontibacter sp. G13]WNJ16237.1 hypothetical protein RJD25_15340 [Pontibacter sp. G13]
MNWFRCTQVNVLPVVSGWLMLLLGSIAFIPISSFAQETQLRADYPYTLFEPCLLQDLSFDWKDLGGNRLKLPINVDSLESHALVTRFDYEDTLRDSLFLWFDGISGQAEVEVNGRFLGVNPVAFKPWKLALAPEWLLQCDNELNLRFFEGRKFEMYPNAPLGLIRPVYLVNRDQMMDLAEVNLLSGPANDSMIAAVAPYYGTSAFVFDEYAALRALRPVRDANIKSLWFPFEPGLRMKALCRQMGFLRIDRVNEDQAVAMINAYPLASDEISLIPRFWMDEAGNRTVHYDTYTKWDTYYPTHPSRGERVWVSLFVLIPLLGLYLIKWSAPNFFVNLQALLFKPSLFVDSTNDSTFSNTSMVMFLTIIKQLCLASSLALVVFFMASSYQWEYLNLFRKPSLLMEIFHGESHAGMIFLKCLAMFMVWLVGRQLFLGILGQVYNIKGLAQGALGLDLVGSFPLILGIPVIYSLLLFMNEVWGEAAGIIFLLVALAYMLRVMYVMYIGLGRLFAFSHGMKILYICTFNIVPCLLLL